MGKRPHVLAVPFPAQGHVKPLLKLAYKIADHGIKVTFVNTDSTHEKMIASMANMVNAHGNMVFTSIPDGMKPSDDESRLVESRLLESMQRDMPGYLTELIEKINSSNKDEQVSCVVADTSIGWILETAGRVGVHQVAFCCAAVGNFAIFDHIPKLIEAGIIDVEGNILKSDDVISLSPDIPAWKSTEFPWCFQGDLRLEKFCFEFSLSVQRTTKHAKWLLCNTSYELESAACDFIPKFLPIGPLNISNGTETSACAGSLRFEDESCLSWLNEKPAGSVIYVSFGSYAALSQQQFRELASGLELSGQPFLWVIRSDLLGGAPAEFPDGFLERMGDHGKIVEWAPQEKVLSHPSVACFLTHCGWNSTMEGLSVGVPFLCWPVFGDQFHNQGYICDIWKVGLKLDPDENGIKSGNEIKTKIQLLLSDDDVKANALKLKIMVQESVCQGGSSFKNFESFIKFLNY